MSRFLTFVLILVFLVISSFLSLYWQIYSVDSKARQLQPPMPEYGSSHLLDQRRYENSIVGKSSFEHSFRQSHLIDWRLFARALDERPSRFFLNFEDGGGLNGGGLKRSSNDGLKWAQFFRAGQKQGLDFPAIPFNLLKSDDTTFGNQCTLQMALELISGVLEADIRALLISKMDYRYRLWRSLQNPGPPPRSPIDKWEATTQNNSAGSESGNLGRNLRGQDTNLNPVVDHSKTFPLLVGDLALLQNDPHKVPPIYVITATIHKNQQKADLTRLSQTLMLVPNLHWIVVEDSPNLTNLVARLLRRSGLSYTHLNVETPTKIKEQLKSQPYRPRGSEQRNKGIEWLKNFHQYSLELASGKDKMGDDIITPSVWKFFRSAMASSFNSPGKTTPGVVYFADDDNSYDLQIFEEMRYVKKVGVWPVGLVGGLILEKPSVSPQGKVSGWVVAFGPHRPFALDMAGFAINLDLLLSTQGAKFEVYTYVGFVESSLLKRLVTLDDLEPLAENCTKVYVWHTKTQSPELQYEEKFTKQFHHPSNLGIEV